MDGAMKIPYKYEVRFMVVTLLAIILIYGAQFIVWLMPVSFWVEYHDIYIAERHAKVKEDLHWISYLTVYRDVQMKYNDIIRCEKNKTEDEDDFKRSQNSKNIWVEKSDGPYEAPWTFVDPGIKEPDTCYGEHNIEVIVWFGQSKMIKHVGKPFPVFGED